MTEFQRAELREISIDKQGNTTGTGNTTNTLKVQFNPETLRVSYSVQRTGGDQRGGSARQNTGTNATRLSFDLWFDLTTPHFDEQGAAKYTDIRKWTEKVNFFIRPNSKHSNQTPGVRFIWGTFMFDGYIDSINETLDYFSEDGIPLRANLSITMSNQRVEMVFSDSAGNAGGAATPTGTTPLSARQGDSVQQMAARQGNPGGWKSIAAANDIENPRQIPSGTLLNTRPNRR